ncbi:MAG TPA: hypothetical protein VNO21_15250 [Polyangiaceae bacterium]|nr:hypothetical protein [Polyangiaceae bacterium]
MSSLTSAFVASLDLVLLWSALSPSPTSLMDRGGLGWGSRESLLLFAVLLLVHAALSAFGAALHLLSAPPQVTRARAYFFLLATLFHFFIPVIGFLGMTLVMHLGLSARRALAPADWASFSFEGDAIGKRAPPKRRTITVSSIEETLRSAVASPEKRFHAVLQTRHLPQKQAISLLKLALKDTSDEVRLFAFSRLERFRNDLETQSRDLSEKLSEADEGAKALLHLRLAETYWEIAYLGLAEGAVREHALKSAQDNAEAACKLRPGSAPAEFLSGRVSLVQKKYGDALTAFERAVHAGTTRLKALPYMAECAFHQKRYDEVRAMLHEVAASGQEAVGFQSVVEFWR